MNSTDTITTKIARRAGILVALASVAAAMAVPASSLASAPVQFGAQLNSTTDPANSLPAHPCNEMAPGKACTIVENEARYRPDGGERAPKTGTIKRIRLVAGGPGSFQLQIAQVKRSTLFGTNEAKVVRNGPVIHYTGQTEANFEESVFKVESFKVNVPVKKGQYLAIKASSTSALYCAGGGNNILTYSPPLSAGGSFRSATSTDGCDLLLGAVIK
jgi:hypothetical protein